MRIGGGSGQGWSRIVKLGQVLSRVVKRSQTWSKGGRKGSREMAVMNGQEMSRIVKLCQTMVKHCRIRAACLETSGTLVTLSFSL